MSSNSTVTLTTTLGNEVSAAAGLGLAAAQLTFDDEFNGFTSSPGTTGWRTMLPYYGAAARTLPTGETDYYSDSTVGVNPFTDSNGVLTITSARTKPSGATYNQPWTSGLIQSQNLATQTYGYFETGINVTSTAGFWPSFWLTSLDPTYLGEIDSAEILTSNGKQLYNTTHVVTTGGAKVATLTQVNLPTSLSQGFHAIGVDWEPDYVTWYIDGVVSSRQPTAVYGLDQPMFMVLCQAVGGWAGTPAASTNSAAMNIDYVRTYATANTVSVAGSGAILTAAVSGTVQTSPGVGLGGVTVTVVDAASQVVKSGTTDAMGAFTIGGLAAGTYRLLYTAPAGYLPASGSAANTMSGLTGTLTLGDGQTATVPVETMIAGTAGRITGSVVYKTNTWSTPPALSGVTVSLMSGNATIATTVTDANGTYLFTNVAAGSYTVKYTPQRYKALSAGPANNGTGLTAAVTVPPGATAMLATETVVPAPGMLTGKILFDADGAGPGAAVAMGGVALTMKDYYGNLLGTTTTASDGWYALTGIAPGYDYLTVTLPAGDVVMTGSVTSKTFVASARTTVADTITLSNASTTGSVTGSVLFGASAEAGVTIVLLNASGTAVGTATTNGSGVFNIGGVAPGTYTLSYAAPANQNPLSGPNGTAVTVTAGKTLTVANEVLGATPATITGTVTLGGAGQAGVAVALLTTAGATVASTATNASGVFSFSVAPGSYKLSYAAPANESLFSGPNGSTITVAAGQNLTLAAETLAANPATIAGTVLYQGTGQAGTVVTLMNAAGITPVATATSNATGAFSFTGIPPGSYRLSYAAPTNEILQSGPNGSAVTVTAGQALTLAPETFAPTPATISGSVLYQGSGQAGVSVTLLDVTGTNSVATAISDATGGFGFSGIAPGSYKLSYATPTNEILQSGPDGSTVSVTAGQALTLAPETLNPAAATITGTLLFAGAPEVGRTVTLLDGTGAAVSTAMTDTTGAFTFGNLTAGTYQVLYADLPGEAFQSGDSADTTTGLTAPLVLTAGQTLGLGVEHLLLAPIALTATGNATLSRGAGNYAVTAPAAVNRATVSLGDGTQSVNLSGWRDSITIGDGNQSITLTGNSMSVATGGGAQTIVLNNSGFSTVTFGDTPTGTSSIVQFNGQQNVINGGNGSVVVNGAGASGYTTVALGNGNDTVTLGGSYNSVSVGAGASTINVGSAGTYYSTVHVSGSGSSGAVTVNIGGKGNTVDVGAGTTFINVVPGSAADTFVLNGANQGLTTISGYSLTGGTLDLTRTLAGTGIGTNLSKIGTYVTATSVNNGADTLLSVDPTGGSGTPYGFALLSGIPTSRTMVADMLAKNDFVLH